MSHTIRRAKPTDSAFIAWGLSEAVGAAISSPRIATELPLLIERTDVLYSWQHAFIAEVDGHLAGVCIAYDGVHYAEMRATTFPLLCDIVSSHSYEESYFATMDDESTAGEYYIDTLAVLPEFRRRGIGNDLLRTAIDEGIRRNLLPTLAVHPENTRAQALYHSLGFRHNGDMNIFGENYWRYALIPQE